MFERPKETQEILAEKLNNLREVADSESSEFRYQFIRRQPTASIISKANGADVSEHITNFPPQSITNNSEVGGDVVELGDTVIYKYLHDGKIASARIINGQGNPNTGTINALTPLAKSILGSTEGDEVSFLSPGGEIKLIIKSIEKS
ncbi:MAG: GreA/GreB family elongation factor [Nitrosomonadales bacterium]